MDKKNKTHLYAAKGTHYRSRDTDRLNVRGWKYTFQSNRNEKKAGVAVLISDKIDFKTKTV